MSVDKKILREIEKYNRINNYISEQFETADTPAEPTDTAEPTAEPAVDEIPEPIDTATDPDVEKIDDEGNSEDTTETSGDVEELDITDLVTAQKDIQSKQEEYMGGMMEKLNDLEEKLSAMDSIFDKINSIENKIEKYREKSPEEKLQLRSLDSYPYNQKLTDFFVDKQEEMEKSGKNEYVLTDDEVEDFSPSEIKKTFNVFRNENN
jgi:hypothetical protein